MKKHSIILAMIASALVSCSKDSPAPTLDVDSRTISATCEGGTFTFNIQSNFPWTVTPADAIGWCTVSPTYGSGNSAVTVTVDKYTEAVPRTAKFVISCSETTLVTDVTLTQTGPAAPAEPGKETLFAIANGGEFEVVVPSGYTYTAASEESWVGVASTGDGLLKFTIAPYENASENRTATLTASLTDGTLLETVEIEQSWRNAEPGDLLIEEVYFSGSAVEGSDTADSDQYIRITNNADHTVYADRVLFAMSVVSSQVSSTGASWTYPELPGHIGVSTIYMIPGNGSDVPLGSGESLILSISAQNYKEGNANSIDLSTADFEFYDENDYFPDTDNPDVPNLDCWFKSSLSITTLHGRGYESYALAYLPATYDADTFMAEFPWEGSRVMDWNGYHFERAITDAYIIPNEWVLDAVNCGVEEFLGTLAFNSTVDAGYTGCGKIDSDPDRIGKSARRISVNGKLSDTNNSTNDFQRDATPSLAN